MLQAMRRVCTFRAYPSLFYPMHIPYLLLMSCLKLRFQGITSNTHRDSIETVGINEGKRGIRGIQ